MIMNDSELLTAAKEAAQEIFQKMEKLEHLQNAHKCLEEGVLMIQMPDETMVEIDDITDMQYEEIREHLHRLFDVNMVEVREYLLKMSGKGIMTNPVFEELAEKAEEAPKKKAGRPKKESK